MQTLTKKKNNKVEGGGGDVTALSLPLRKNLKWGQKTTKTNAQHTTCRHLRENSLERTQKSYRRQAGTLQSHDVNENAVLTAVIASSKSNSQCRKRECEAHCNINSVQT